MNHGLQSHPSRPRRRRAARIAIAGTLVIASLLLGELGARGLLLALGRPYDSEHARAILVARLGSLGALPAAFSGVGYGPNTEKAPLLRRVHPYVGWELPAYESWFTAETEWYRGGEAAATYDICVLGGSVASGFGIEGGERLVQKLSADPRFAGRPIQLHNHGRPAYKQPQQLMLLCYLLSLGHRPDAVLEIDGFNEAALAWSNVKNGSHPIYPEHNQWITLVREQQIDWELVELSHAARASRDQARAFAEWALASGVLRSGVLGTVVLKRYQVLHRRWVGAQAAVTARGEAGLVHATPTGPPLQTDEMLNFVALIRCWEESSVTMAAICAGRSIDYLHVLQPTLHDAGSKPLTPAEIADSGTPADWIAGVQKAYPLMRRAADRLHANGVAFYDASMLFQHTAERLYFDGCHYGERGNELLADAVGEALLESLAAER